MTKYENIIKQKAQNKEPADIDALAKKYKMNVMDVKKLKDDRGPLDLTRVLEEKETEINDLKNKMADLEEDLHSKDYWEKPDYKFLVNENLDLRRKITELEQEVLETKLDNKKLAQQISIMMERMRDADF